MVQTSKDVFQSIFDNPLLPSEGTIFRRAFFSPFEDTVKMEMMQALSLDGHAIITWHFASRAGRFKGKLADCAALFSLNIPFPGGNCIPCVDFDLHLFL